MRFVTARSVFFSVSLPFLLFSLLFLLVISSAFAIRATAGVATTVDVSALGCTTSCQKITNNIAGGADIFVPDGSCTDWNNFLSHLPNGVTAGACCTVLTWYLDADGDGYTPVAPQSSCTSPGAGWSTTPKTAGDCDDSNSGIYLGVTRTRYNTLSVACGTACQSETQTCQASSTWSGSYGGTSCSASTRTMYSTSNPSCGQSCGGDSESQTCQAGGSWSGSYGSSSCTDPSGCYTYHNSQSCHNGNIYWYDSDGNPNDVATTCNAANSCSGNTLNINGGCMPGATTCGTGTLDCTSPSALSVPNYPYCGGSTLVTGGICSGTSCTQTTTSCGNGCSGSPGSAACNTCTSHSYQSCGGTTSLAWYDSCGNRQDTVQDCAHAPTCGGGNILIGACNELEEACVDTIQTSCPNGFYCAGNGNLDYASGCTGSSCNSPTYDMPCPSGNDCLNNERVTYTGCAGGNCGYNVVEDCGPSHGDRCVGGIHYYGSWTCGGGGSFCQYAASEVCTYGCNGNTCCPGPGSCA